jgi:hypothetical protein
MRRRRRLASVVLALARPGFASPDYGDRLIETIKPDAASVGD